MGSRQELYHVVTRHFGGALWVGDESDEYSREAAQDYSPRRKPWVERGIDSAPKGRKNTCDADSFSFSGHEPLFMEFCPARRGAPRLRRPRLLDQLQTRAILFSSLIYRYNRASQRRQLPQLLLDVLEPFMSLPVGNLVQRSIALLTSILLVQFVNLSNFRS